MSAHSARRFIRTSGVTAGLLALCASPLLAHPGSGATSGLLHGMAHPLAGMDHLLAMIAVGLWAAQGEGSSRSIWVLPASFVGGMLLGGLLGMWGTTLPAVEAGILLSVVVLGAFVAAALRPAAVVSILIVAAFGLLHGHAHGTEMPATMSAMGYVAGFTAATALLHAVGAAAAVWIRGAAGNTEGMAWVRVAGSAIAAAGMVLVLAA